MYDAKILTNIKEFKLIGINYTLRTLMTPHNISSKVRDNRKYTMFYKVNFKTKKLTVVFQKPYVHVPGNYTWNKLSTTKTFKFKYSPKGGPTQ